MRKGDLVKFNTESSEVSSVIRDAEYFGGPAVVRTYRPTTSDEKEAWRESKYQATLEAHAKGEDTFHINFDDGGESRLPPRSVAVPLPVDGIFIVERARCRVSLGWGNPTGGMAKIVFPKTGDVTFVKRDMLEAVT